MIIDEENKNAPLPKFFADSEGAFLQKSPFGGVRGSAPPPSGFTERRRRMLNLSQRNKKLLAAVALVLVAALGVFAVTRYVGKQRDAAYLESYGQTALYVGGYTANYELYRYFYLNYKDELAADYKNADGKTETAALDRAVRERVAEAVRGLYGTLSLAADYGMNESDGDVRASAIEYIDAVKEYYGASDYAAELADNYMTENVFDFLIRVDGVEDKLFAALTAEGGAIESGEEALLEIFRSDEFVRVKQIYIENDKGEDVENNRRIAEEAVAEYRAGVDFNTLIGRYSEDFAMPSEGYYFTHGEMIDEFETAAFALADGEVSGTVESANGFHIILRLPKEDDYITSHFEELKSQYQNARFYAMIDERADKLSVSEADYVRSLKAEEIR